MIINILIRLTRIVCLLIHIGKHQILRSVIRCEVRFDIQTAYDMKPATREEQYQQTL